jgi:1-acyl-sn-glycerol-3-phosphate acyltransferase
VATPTPQLERCNVEAQVIAITRDLLEELGSPQARCTPSVSAQLDRDLGLGSLERVELLVRLSRAFRTSLPDRVVAEADTLNEVIAALTETPTAPASPLHGTASPPFTTQLPPLDITNTSDVPVSAQTWQEVLRHRAHASATRPHLILCEGDSEAPPISFADLYDGAQRVASRLAVKGIGHGDAVGLMLPTSLEFFFTFAGVLLAGAVPVPIYPPVRADRIAEYAERQSAILHNAQARLLVTFREAERVAKFLRPKVPSLQGIVTAAELLSETHSHGIAAPRPPPGAEPSDLALLQYTSGSTGNPKGVQLTHANLLANVRAIGQALAIRPDDVGVSWLPLYHDMGLIGAWLMPLYFGLPVFVLSPISFLGRPERWLRTLHRHRATLTAAPNFAYELAVNKISDADMQGLDLSALRASLNGAEPVNPATLDRFARRFAPCGFRREALLPVYGLAESSLAVTIPPLGREPRVDRVSRDPFTREGRAVPVAAPSLNDSNDSAANDPSILSFVSVGRSLANHEVRIANAAGHEAEEREEGALWFRGPSTTSGYFRNQEASNALFPQGRANGWLNSGDRAYRANGEFFITGRVKDIILKAGRNLYPHEIEDVASRIKGVRKGCVVAFGAADAASGTERLIIVAETQEKEELAKRVLAQQIITAVSQAIGVPPDSVEMLPPRAIPKTSSGKLRRDQTRRLYLARKLGVAQPPAWRQAAKLIAASAARSVKLWPRRAAGALYGACALAVFAAFLVPTWIAVYLAPNRRIAARITTSALRAYLAMIGCRVRVNGRDNLILRTPAVLVCNHTSYADVLVLMAAFDVDYHFVAKSEVRNMPLIGTFLRKLGHFSFDRSDPRARLRQEEQMESALNHGQSVFVFPEGTFTAQEGVRPFHLGAFKAAVHTHCPIVPIALQGTRQLLRDGTYLPRRTAVTLTICPPLEPPSTDSSSEWKQIVRLRDAARETISLHSGEPLL